MISNKNERERKKKMVNRYQNSIKDTFSLNTRTFVLGYKRCSSNEKERKNIREIYETDQKLSFG